MLRHSGIDEVQLASAAKQLTTNLSPDKHKVRLSTAYERTSRAGPETYVAVRQLAPLDHVSQPKMPSIQPQFVAAQDGLL